ncbi:trypsin-like peptidase domain-containing protein [Staphylococcus pseudintermedius]|uniref:trypsin-like serine peptidase n=5 Tax=Staphylococcus pseudintermedius TaxID=283734 RepID=UPI001EE3DCB3|nr:trypsin-like peptidase domain-containing protein [Staphylococcus pseudintermedius]MDF0028908.1 trypsin-like peptidase domain-containing protein [Staphylococcus pseudintermedius]MDF0173105.1 trypsin-like peptidase domain-containing protein [Staphylococcus pseudintermedius]MDF0219459.1 trypsin-like peptidase domain-containing protein [Staphylococcus pseudintermedius]MDF0309875.1 trypsin-like peptidase domain-containing protein [Staphylococcus pseudintermedius]MDK3686460.1 trypsin-like peptida
MLLSLCIYIYIKEGEEDKIKKVTKLVFIVLFLSMYTPSYVNAEEFIADDGIIESQATDISAMPGDILPMPSTEASTQSKVNFNNTDNYGDFFPHVESVIGTDERKKVTSFTSSPIKENVAIKVEWKNSEGNYEGYVASGVMVSKDTVLTAAHVVYDEGRKKIAERITVYSGLYGNIIRGSAKGIKTYVLKGYTSTLDSKYDLAAIKLDTNLGSLTGSLGITSTIALGDKIATAGYPDDKTDRTNSSDLKYYMWRSTGKIMNLDKYRVYYDADTSGGQSGSGVWDVKSNKLVAIHTNGGKTFNFGTRITPQYLDYIKYWIGTPVAHTYNKKVSISKEGQQLWGDLQFLKVKSEIKGKLGKVYNAKYYYNHPNGNKYLSLYNKDGTWAGYSNMNHSVNVTAVSYNKKVVIIKKKYDLWNSFYFDSKKGKSDAYVNKPVIAKYIYTLGNGRQYYSLYSIKSDKWLGYVNVNATK